MHGALPISRANLSVEPAGRRVFRAGIAMLAVLSCLRLTSAHAELQPASSRPAATSFSSGGSTQEITDHYELIIGDNTPQARRLGATKLLDIGSEDAVSRLTEVLRGNGSTRLPARLAVCEAVAGCERPPVLLLEAMIACLGDKSPGMGDALTRALRRFDTALVVERLRPLASDSEVALERRLAAISALGEAGDDIRAVAALATMLEGTSPTVQAAALTAFSTATGVKHETAEAALAWWARHSTLTGTQWLWRVNEARREQVRRLQAIRGELNRRLVTLSRDAYLATNESDRPNRLLTYLRDELPPVRSLALDLINDLITDRKDIDTDAKSRLVELIADADSTVRLKAAKIASELRLAGALNRLLDALSVEAVPDVRVAQVAALGRLDDAAAVPALILRLNDDALVVSGEAALALGNIARKRIGRTSPAEPILAAVLERYGRLRPADEDVREKFIQAMSRIGDESFRLELRRAIAPVESIRIRRAAIAGLAAYGDAEAADDVRAMLSAQEMEIRQSAAEALGKYGRRLEDVTSLMPHLYAKSESDAAVREQAWQAFMAICDRIPAADVLRLSREFDRAGDKIDQQRRVDLLRVVRVNEARFDGLAPEQRVELLLQLADGQAQIGDFGGSASCLEQASALRRPVDASDAVKLLARALAARLTALEDAAAIQKVIQLAGGLDEADPPIAEPLAEVVLAEARRRVEQAADAQDFSQTMRLLDAAATLLASAEKTAQAAAVRAGAVSRRAELIDRLLLDFMVDGEAESKIVNFGPELVVPPLAALLGAGEPGESNRPANRILTAGAEQRLINLARRLVPQWEALDPSVDVEKRAESLAALRKLAASATATPRRPDKA